MVCARDQESYFSFFYRKKLPVQDPRIARRVEGQNRQSPKYSFIFEPESILILFFHVIDIFLWCCVLFLCLSCAIDDVVYFNEVVSLFCHRIQTLLSGSSTLT